MALNCCTYEHLGCVDFCRPVLSLGDSLALMGFTIHLQHNSALEEIGFTTDNDGNFQLDMELLPNNMYYFKLFDSDGEDLGCYKFKTETWR